MICFLPMQSFGGLTGVEVDPNNANNLIFTFRTRTDAEKVQLYFKAVVLFHALLYFLLPQWDIFERFIYGMLLLMQHTCINGCLCTRLLQMSYNFWQLLCITLVTIVTWHVKSSSKQEIKIKSSKVRYVWTNDLIIKDDLWIFFSFFFFSVFVYYFLSFITNRICNVFFI